MLHKHVSVICVQARDDERTERFVVFSSELPPRGWCTWPQSAHSSMTCIGLIRDDQLGEVFRPYRSVAAWYCWRAVDTVLPTAA